MVVVSCMADPVIVFPVEVTGFLELPDIAVAVLGFPGLVFTVECSR
jgi:hypothetical protein